VSSTPIYAPGEPAGSPPAPGAGRGTAGMNDPADARVLGRALKAARHAAGYTQAQLARRAGYARSTVSTAESSGQHASRVFWQRCEQALPGTGTALTARYDRLARLRNASRPQPAADAQTAWQTRDAGQAGQRLNAGTVTDAMTAYQRLGWRAEHAGGRVELVCGTGVEALELPRAAAVIAARWWLHTGGVPDDIRGLPGLPVPQDALAVITAADHWYFLVEPGACPWAAPDLADAPPDEPAPGVVVRWHAGGSRIPAPPSQNGNGQPAAWAYLPPGRIRLADPVALLDLLARAAAVTAHRNLLTLPGGVRVMPARS
jgi:transcriptional regulator with XRE-family HTH domain